MLGHRPRLPPLVSPIAEGRAGRTLRPSHQTGAQGALL